MPSEPLRLLAPQCYVFKYPSCHGGGWPVGRDAYNLKVTASFGRTNVPTDAKQPVRREGWRRVDALCRCARIYARGAGVFVVVGGSWRGGVTYSWSGEEKQTNECVVALSFGLSWTPLIKYANMVCDL